MLLAFYFFLAGIAVTQHPFLWIVPVSTLGFALTSGAAGMAGSALLPAYASWGARQRAGWRANVVHLLFSASVGGGAVAYLASSPSSLLALPDLPSGHAEPAHPVLKTFDAATLLTCCAAGFYGFMLYAMVHGRLVAHRYKVPPPPPLPPPAPPARRAFGSKTIPPNNNEFGPIQALLIICTSLPK